jgi:hypothetical protein
VSLPQGIVPINITGTNEKTYITGRVSIFCPPIMTPTPKTLREKLGAQSGNALVHDVTVIKKEDEFRNIFQRKAYVDLASDGSYDPVTGIMAYGWVIAINHSVVAKGKGPAEAHRTMADSLRAEAYGLASGAFALTIIKEHFNINPMDHAWSVLLDSTSLIKHMESFRKEHAHPKDIFNPHADIIRMAHRLLQPFAADYVHIKGHQDKMANRQGLSFDAKLNIMADELAQNQQSEMKQACNTVTSDGVHIQLNNRTITKDHQRSLLEASSSIPIRQYYKEKYDWQNSTFVNINWSAQNKVLHRYDNNDQRRILKFVHGWLPTYDRLYREQQSPNPQCPLCKNLVEDNLHLFTCKHPQQQEIILTLHKRLESDNTNYGVDTLIHNITMAISRIGQTWTPPHTDEEALNSCLQDQTRIGWKQMLFGRISCTMSAYIGLYLREKGVE